MSATRTWWFNCTLSSGRNLLQQYSKNKVLSLVSAAPHEVQLNSHAFIRLDSFSSIRWVDGREMQSGCVLGNKTHFF